MADLGTIWSRFCLCSAFQRPISVEFLDHLIPKALAGPRHLARASGGCSGDTPAQQRSRDRATPRPMGGVHVSEVSLLNCADAILADHHATSHSSPQQQ
jgi:hypothetical protein